MKYESNFYKIAYRLSSVERQCWKNLIELLGELCIADYGDLKTHYENRFSEKLLYSQVLHFSQLNMLDLFANKENKRFVMLGYNANFFLQKPLDVFEHEQILETLQKNHIIENELPDYSFYKYVSLKNELDQWED